MGALLDVNEPTFWAIMSFLMISLIGFGVLTLLLKRIQPKNPVDPLLKDRPHSGQNPAGIGGRTVSGRPERIPVPAAVRPGGVENPTGSDASMASRNLQQFRVRVQQQDQTIQELEDRISQLEADLEQRSHLLERREAEMEQVRIKNRRLEAEVASLRDSLDSQCDQFEEYAASLVRTRQRLEQELERLRTKPQPQLGESHLTRPNPAQANGSRGSGIVQAHGPRLTNSRMVNPPTLDRRFAADDDDDLSSARTPSFTRNPS